MSRLAILSALHDELSALLGAVDGARRVVRGGREFHVGTLQGRAVVLALGGVGKVAAATTASLLLSLFDTRAVLFTGVAGGLGDGVQVGDVVVADALLQHDLDASPLFPRFEVPHAGVSRYPADAAMSAALAEAVPGALAALREPLAALDVSSARLHRGLVVSGDRFVNSSGESAALRALLPDALAVEMEGAAVAQVCHDFGVPFALLRTVSDRADDQAHVDFVRFLREVASVVSRQVVCAALRHEAFTLPRPPARAQA